MECMVMSSNRKSLTQAIEKIAEEIARERELEAEKKQIERAQEVTQSHNSQLESAQ